MFVYADVFMARYGYVVGRWRCIYKLTTLPLILCEFQLIRLGDRFVAAGAQTCEERRRSVRSITSNF